MLHEKTRGVTMHLFMIQYIYTFNSYKVVHILTHTFHVNFWRYLLRSFGCFFLQVLLVQGFWAKSSWGFPKGKVNEEEVEHNCAQREVI